MVVGVMVVWLVEMYVVEVMVMVDEALVYEVGVAVGTACARPEEEEIRPEDHAQYQAAKRRDTI